MLERTCLNRAGSALRLMIYSVMIALLTSALILQAKPEFVTNGHSPVLHPDKNKMAFVRGKASFMRDLSTGSEERMMAVENRIIHMMGWDETGDNILMFLSPMEWAAKDFDARANAALLGLTKKDAGFEDKTDIYSFKPEDSTETDRGLIKGGKLIESYDHPTDGFSLGPQGLISTWGTTVSIFGNSQVQRHSSLIDTANSKVTNSPAFQMHFTTDQKRILVFVDEGIGLVNNQTRKQNTVVKKWSGVTEAAITNDGSKIAYLLKVTNENDKAVYELHLLDSVAKTKGVIASYPLESFDKIGTPPECLAFSADGSYLYFSQYHWMDDKPLKTRAAPQRIFRIKI